MIKSLFFLIVASVLVAPSISYTTEDVPRYNLVNLLIQNSISNLMREQDLQNGIQNGLELLNQFKHPPKHERPSASLPDFTTLQDTLFANLTNLSSDFYRGWLEANLVYFINSSTILNDVEKGLIINSLPAILGSTSLEELVENSNPLILIGIAAYFQDPTIPFSPAPLTVAFTRLLQQYFDSPQAPEFLRNDTVLQTFIIDYTINILSLNDPLAVFVQLQTDLLTYFNTLAAQDIRNFLQQFFPEIYIIVQNESNLNSLLATVYRYIVTQAVDLYGQILNFFMSSQEMLVMNSMNQTGISQFNWVFIQNVMSQANSNTLFRNLMNPMMF